MACRVNVAPRPTSGNRQPLCVLRTLEIDMTNANNLILGCTRLLYCNVYVAYIRALFTGGTVSPQHLLADLVQLLGSKGQGHSIALSVWSHFVSVLGKVGGGVQREREGRVGEGDCGMFVVEDILH